MNLAPNMSNKSGKSLTIDIAPSDLRRYLVESRMGIIAILNTLQKTGSLVTGYFGGGNNFILTSIVAVEPELDRLILDYGADSAANLRVLDAKRITFVAMHERIKMQFYATSLQHVRFEDRDAFSTAFPTALLRLQRREYYRIVTPLTLPLKCIIEQQAAPKHKPLEVNIVDISCGGIAIIDSGATVELGTGTCFRDCRILLPDIGEVKTDILIKSTFDIVLKNGTKRTQAGCEFVGMVEHERAKIQRYINKAERESKGRAR